MAVHGREQWDSQPLKRKLVSAGLHVDPASINRTYRAITLITCISPTVV